MCGEQNRWCVMRANGEYQDAKMVNDKRENGGVIHEGRESWRGACRLVRDICSVINPHKDPFEEVKPLLRDLDFHVGGVPVDISLPPSAGFSMVPLRVTLGPSVEFDYRWDIVGVVPSEELAERHVIQLFSAERVSPTKANNQVTWNEKRSCSGIGSGSRDDFTCQHLCGEIRGVETSRLTRFPCLILGYAEGLRVPIGIVAELVHPLRRVDIGLIRDEKANVATASLRASG
ncbi:hypothetical protein H5410_014398 [Solanum commersonii]|uniref:Uncharacterized protein n=1 Tax=Solanum commersonii TaxID=4109 RepID=A0A9J5ZQV4_SOLCO|nr:hypothetical protein H5410_014398 [Solanum commersonii]